MLGKAVSGDPGLEIQRCLDRAELGAPACAESKFKCVGRTRCMVSDA